MKRTDGNGLRPYPEERLYAKVMNSADPTLHIYIIGLGLGIPGIPGTGGSAISGATTRPRPWEHIRTSSRDGGMFCDRKDMEGGTGAPA